MTSEGLGEMFEGASADTCAGKFPLVSMGGRAEGLNKVILNIALAYNRTEFFQAQHIQILGDISYKHVKFYLLYTFP